MTTLTMDDVQIKNLFKQAIIELVHERKDLLADVEDVAMRNAIEEGLETEIVIRDEVFQILAV